MPAPPYSSSTVIPSTPSAPDLAPQVGGKCVVAVDVGGARRDLVGGERLHLAAQHVDGLAEVEVQAEVRIEPECHVRTSPGREPAAPRP